MRWRRSGLVLASECGRWLIAAHPARRFCVLHRLSPNGARPVVGRFPRVRDAAREAQRRAG